MRQNSVFKVYGLFGYPVKHTLSPNMHNEVFKTLGLNAVYLPLEFNPQYFRTIFSDRRNIILDGFNVTIPYKETVLKYLDRISPEAKIIGAVNTVKKTGKRLTGYNTDAYGFSESLRLAGFRFKNKVILLFGAGGAARAALYVALKQLAGKVVIVEIDLNKAKKLKKDYLRYFPKADIEVVSSKEKGRVKSFLRKADLLVNATGVGLKKGDPSLVTGRDFAGCGKLIVYDMIYNPPLPALLRIARRCRLKTINGLDMLIYQGAKAFEIWTGERAPVKVMRKALSGTAE